MMKHCVTEVYFVEECFFQLMSCCAANDKSYMEPKQNDRKLRISYVEIVKVEIMKIVEI